MQLVGLGASHATAPAKVRDALAMDADEITSVATRIRSTEEHVAEVVVLSTCHRMELYAAVSDLAEGSRVLRSAVTAQKTVDYFENGKYTRQRTGRDAARHLLRVACGIDSLMIGEPQILGQVKDALLLADRAGTCGALLNRLFNAALHAGKRARAETAIGHGAVSVAYAAVGMACKVFGDLSKKTVLLVGAGETGKLLGLHLHDESPLRITVMNRTFENAESLAADIGGIAKPIDQMQTALEDADVVVTATASGEPIITSAIVESIAKSRTRRPMLIVDIASPRDVDPAVGKLPNVFLYDLDALQVIVEQNRAARAREIPKVEQIVTEELDRFFQWYGTLAVLPTVRHLRRMFEEIGEREVRKQAKYFHGSDREALEKYTRALINKLLHEPTLRLKELDQSTSDGIAKLAAVHDLFHLLPTDHRAAGDGETT
ncbi:MAG: glutamyl-tRNA reductase [Gemmatimonadales bacterium]